MRLDGRHALITGGLGTIGRAIAGAFQEAGAQVTLLDRPELEAREGFGWLPVDLRDPKAAEGAVGMAGPFDVLVNNAALILNKPHEAFSLEEYEEQVRVNSTAAFALARAVAPAMKAQGWGRILNLTSLTLNGQRSGAAGRPRPGRGVGRPVRAGQRTLFVRRARRSWAALQGEARVRSEPDAYIGIVPDPSPHMGRWAGHEAVQER